MIKMPTVKNSDETMQAVEKTRSVLLNNMKMLRDSLQWNQGRLAEESGLSLSYIKNIEIGKQWPSPASIESIAKALNVSVSRLLEDREKRVVTVEEAIEVLARAHGLDVIKKN